MASRANIVARPPMRSATIGPFIGTFKLTGIVIKSDPRGSYKPSRVIELVVDGETRTAAFHLRETLSTLTWEVKPAVVITAKSVISIQPYEARSLIKRKKKEVVTIQGEAVFRYCASRPGDKHDFERGCAGFTVIISVVAQKDAKARDKTRSGLDGRTVLPGENEQEVFFGPPTAPNSFKRSLNSLHDLMELIPPDSRLHEAARETRDVLTAACNFMPTDDVDPGIRNLGEQVHDLLVEMQLPRFSERLASHWQTSTITYLLLLISNAAVFAEDCSKLKFKEPGAVDLQKTLEEFDQQFVILRRNFTSGKQTYWWNQPYIRPQLPTSPAPLLSAEEHTGSEVGTVDQESDTRTIIVDEDQTLQNFLKPDDTPSDLLHLSCLDSTRREILSDITSWFDDITKPNVLWLSGAPGTGKTALAWSLIAELERQQRAAGEFFFRSGKHWPDHLWRTLAFNMAKFHPAIKNDVYRTLRREENFPLDDVQMTFDQLIAKPLKALAPRLSNRRPVVLIDGLEQCGRGYSSWQTLLDTLPQWLNLPRHCKLIITSRPQNDITKAFEGLDIKRIELLTGENVDIDTNSDVHIYLAYRFAEMRKQDTSIPESWPDYDAMYKLANHTAGFFKWAAVAVDAIQVAGDRERYLTSVIEGGTTTTFQDFDQYLENILRMAFNIIPTEAFRATMGTIALSKQPLTMEDLALFLQYRFTPTFEPSLEEMCSKLLPIISIEGENKMVKVRHKAYKDYFIDPKRCTAFDNVFLIDRSRAHRKMTISCLKIMQQGLKFNICGLKSSYKMNYDVEGLGRLVDKCIPSYLSYACQYWADHLRGIVSTEKRDTDIVNLLRNFLNSYLLYWLEALSLMSKSYIASKSLLITAEWLEATDKDLSLMASDASRFSLTFADAISLSAPHIYLSALPFAPPLSLVSKRYRDQFPRTIRVFHEEGIKWPPMRYSISTNDSVYCISIHPDGKRVVAARSSSIAMVISVATGDTLFNLSGHGGGVNAVAYSPSGKRIATGCDDRRLRIYESENGSLLFGPFEIHADCIRSLSWSPDGQRVVTGSDDRRVKVCAIETGQVIFDTAFHDECVRSVIFGSEFFFSGSDDRTVRIYDASTGTASGEAWSAGQTSSIRAIAISPDNKILAAGGHDCSIVLFNMDTRSMINQTIRGHTGAIRSLAFSKDGQILASGGEDYTIRLWNVRTGRKICDPLHGHTYNVSSVRFTSDMKQLVTGGEDGTVRFFDMDSLPIGKNSSGNASTFLAATPSDDGNTVFACDGSSISRWNVDVGRVDNVPFEGNLDHLMGIRSVSISPDGRLVATSASDLTVIIWQTDSGKMLWGPLEGHCDDIYALGFSADSKMVVSGGDDRNIWVWSTETGQSICGPMDGHMALVRSVCFSPDGKQVASGSGDCTAIMWSIESGEKLHDPLTFHRDWIGAIAYSPDGRYLATASDDFNIAIWNVATGEHVSHIFTGYEGYVRLVNWSPDSNNIICGLYYVIRIYDVETGTLLGEPLTGHKNYLTALSMRSSLHSSSPEVVSASQDGTVRVWGLRMKSFVKTRTFSIYHSDWIHAISFSPVDDHIASGGDDGHLVVIDVVTGTHKFTIVAHQDWIRCVTYSPDGKKIATCSDDRMISIWDADTGERVLERLEGHTGAVMSIEFSPGGNFIVSGSADGTVRTWDLHPMFIKLNNPLCTYRGHNSAVNAVTYASGGELIVSGSASGEIAVWEGNLSDKCIRRFGGRGGAILSLRVSDDSKIFSSSEDHSIRVWELSTGQELKAILNGHTAPINAIALTPDGKRIISVSDDATLRVFDADSGELSALPLHLSDRVFAVAVSRDGTLVACSGADLCVHVWRANIARREVWPDNFIRKARGREFCLVDEQGFLSDFSQPDDGWLRGSTNQPMFWIPSVYRMGLWTPRTVGILGALETIVDVRNFVHGTNWEQCTANVSAGKAT